MTKLTIQLKQEVEKAARLAALSEGMSLSQWIACLVEQQVGGEVICDSEKPDEWPQSVRDLAGAWKNFPTAEEIRNSTE